MKTTIGLLAGIGLLGIASLAFALMPEFRRIKGPDRRVERTPILVELFTSEGCSSCPPADRFLAKIEKEQPAPGALIIPLSEHVDYWNSDHWSDRFSSPLFSLRQAQYVKALRADGSYTPQMVVDGRSEFVGSDESAASQAISRALRVPKAQVGVSVLGAGGNRVSVHVAVSGLPATADRDPKEIYIAVAEDNLHSQVAGGENEGRHLEHTAVVRLLKKLGPAEATGPTSLTLDLDQKWKRSDLSFVAFIQSRGSRHIDGVGLARL